MLAVKIRGGDSGEGGVGGGQGERGKGKRGGKLSSLGSIQTGVSLPPSQGRIKNAVRGKEETP